MESISSPQNSILTGWSSAGEDGWSLPVSDVTFDFGGEEGEYELCMVKDGKIVTKFRGNPNKFFCIRLTGVGGSLRSEFGVTVEGDVNGSAESGLEMKVFGNVNGPANAGLGMTCGDVAGNASAGMSLSESAGFFQQRKHCRPWPPAGLRSCAGRWKNLQTVTRSAAAAPHPGRLPQR